MADINEARALAESLPRYQCIEIPCQPPDACWCSMQVAASATILALAERLEAVEKLAYDLEARLATATEALRTLVSHLNSCKHHERGAGGMTIDAQINRSVLLDVRLRWVVDAEETLSQIEAGTVKHPDSVKLKWNLPPSSSMIFENRAGAFEEGGEHPDSVRLREAVDCVQGWYDAFSTGRNEPLAIMKDATETFLATLGGTNGK